jgi:outer membrane protein assembly factor BamE (lipoprotein component of BamABCDE complex)
MQRAILTLALAFGVTAGVSAQEAKSIDPGMTQAQVAERLGAPAAVRTSGNFTYLFYKNNCVKQCGIDDLVILESDGVIDAVFRSPARRYTGVSSSPEAITASQAHNNRVGAETATAVAVPADSSSAATQPDSAAAPRSTLRIKTTSAAAQQGTPAKAAKTDTTTRRP